MLILLEIVVVAAVVFAAAAWAVGAWTDGLTVQPPDAGSDGLPDGRLAPAEIDRARFGLAFRGYRMGEVDHVLDRLRDELAARDAEIDALKGVADTAVDPAVATEHDHEGEERAPLDGALEAPVDTAFAPDADDAADPAASADAPVETEGAHRDRTDES